MPQTPQFLIDDGIYQQLALTWFEPPHREISVALTAKKLGAEQGKGMPIARLLTQIRRATSRVSLHRVDRGAASQADRGWDRSATTAGRDALDAVQT